MRCRKAMTVESTVTTSSALQFTSKERDSETGLDFLGASMNTRYHHAADQGAIKGMRCDAGLAGLGQNVNGACMCAAVWGERAYFSISEAECCWRFPASPVTTLI